MLLVKNAHTNPYFNLASEEYFLDRFRDDVVLLWRNDKTVVVGRHQNTIEEINQDYVREKGIGVVRRLSGGGAVFHDLGNVNFSIIRSFDENLFSDYAYFTRPVLEFLGTLGVRAELSGRNDLLIDGMKVSGNAQARRSGRIMHHGTLLFSADVADISGALKPSQLKIESKSIKSVRSRVTNISSHLKDSMGVEEFMDRLYRYFLQDVPGSVEYDLSSEDEAAIEALVASKYGTWDWNYGKSPSYSFRKERKFDYGLVDLRFMVREGRIEDLKLYGDYFGTADVADLEGLFQGIPHRGDACREVLADLPGGIGAYVAGMTDEDFLSLTF